MSTIGSPYRSSTGYVREDGKYRFHSTITIYIKTNSIPYQ